MSDYREDIQIDEYTLETEWVKQSSLYMKWAEKHAEAVRVKDRYKEQLDLTKAELDFLIRAEPEKFNMTKVTEPAIVNAIYQNKEYIEALKKYNDAVTDTHIFKGAMDALNHKKTALENLTKLWLNSYYSDSNFPEQKKLVKEPTEEDRTKIKKKLKKIKLKRRK